MDDLDRLAFRVARTVRTTYPHLLEHGFTLADLEERLAPYPEARREMASGGLDGYELTVLRLLAGERGYLAAEPELQEACRRAMQMASPTVSIVRTWASSTLTLRQQAFSLATERGATPPATAGAGDTLNQMFAMHDEPTRTGSQEVHVNRVESPEPLSSGCQCHFCGGTLPTARTLKFCPYCGLDLTVRHCPACSTELERTWQFCVTCGRQTEDVEALVGTGADSSRRVATPPRPET